MLKKKEFWIVLSILAIGIFFRFYLIKVMPGGLFPDEAADGLDVNLLLKGFLQPFYARANGREGLFQYLLAASVSIFGRGPWQHHIVSAGIGVLSILTVYLMTKRLFGKTTGYVASFLMAVGTWHIVLSRTAFRAIMIPLFETLVFYFLVRMIQAQGKKERIWSAIFFGAFFAGGFYTYIAYRIMPVILFFLLVVALLADRQQGFKWVKSFCKPIAASVVSGLAVFAPLGWYFLSNPGSFTGRSSQVSIFNKDLNHGHLLLTLWQVLQKAVVAFFAHGDTNWRQNISGSAFLSPLVSPFFGIVLVVAMYFSVVFVIKAFKNKQNNNHWKYLILTCMFWGMLIPEVATDEGIPHGLRSIGTLPAAYIFAAVGLVYLWNKIHQIWHPKFVGYLYKVVAVLYFVVLFFSAYEAYFVYAYNTPENFYAFRSDLTNVSQYLNTHVDPLHNYLVSDLYSVQTVDYFTTTTGNPYTIIDPENSTKLHLQTGDKLIYTQATVYDLERFEFTHNNYKILQVEYDKFNQPVMVAIQITSPDPGGASISRNNDGEFTTIDFGNRLDFAWASILPWQPWHIDIYKCDTAKCLNKTLIKEDNQNDYLSNKDYIITDSTKSDTYYTALAYNQQGLLLKNFGVVKVEKY